MKKQLVSWKSKDLLAPGTGIPTNLSLGWVMAEGNQEHGDGGWERVRRGKAIRALGARRRQCGVVCEK